MKLPIATLKGEQQTSMNAYKSTLDFPHTSYMSSKRFSKLKLNKALRVQA